MVLVKKKKEEEEENKEEDDAVRTQSTPTIKMSCIAGGSKQ